MMPFTKLTIPVAGFSLVMGMSFSDGAEARSQSQSQSDRQSQSDSQSQRSQMESDQESTQQPSSQRQSQARQQRSKGHWSHITGEVEKTKRVSIQGFKQKHLAVLLNTDQGGRAIVDLGPARQLRALDIQEGDKISARGLVVRAGNRRVMLAKQVEVDGQTVKIRRQASQRESMPRGHHIIHEITGEIQNVKDVKLKGMNKTHRVARIETDDGVRFIADLGAKKELRDFSIKKGEQLTVQGPMVSVSGKPLMIATQVSNDEKTAQIDREFLSAMPEGPQGRQSSKHSNGQTQTIEGRVVLKGVVVEVDRDGFYVVQQPNGRQAHLIVAEEMNRGINVGDQIQAQVKQDGTVTSISRMSGQAGGQSAQQSAQSDESQFNQDQSSSPTSGQTGRQSAQQPAQSDEGQFSQDQSSSRRSGQTGGQSIQRSAQSDEGQFSQGQSSSRTSGQIGGQSNQQSAQSDADQFNQDRSNESR